MTYLSAAILAVVFLGLLHGSWQRDCFTSQCHHDNTFDQCVSGDWNCHANEFCEVLTTHIMNSPFISMKCKNDEERPTCDALAASLNSTECSVSQLTTSCAWCCDDDQCVRDIAAMAP